MKYAAKGNFEIHYPISGTKTCKGKFFLVNVGGDSGVVPFIDPTPLRGKRLPLIVLDPRAVVTLKGVTIYNPRWNKGLAKWAVDWLAENRDWAS